MLAGEAGDYAVIARKVRNARDWFLGAVGDEQQRVVDIPLDFLDAGIDYDAEIYRDGAKADYRTNPRDIVIETRIVNSTSHLRLRVAPGGGAAVRFRFTTRN